jgi:hypothetical protein
MIKAVVNLPDGLGLDSVTTASSDLPHLFPGVARVEQELRREGEPRGLRLTAWTVILSARRRGHPISVTIVSKSILQHDGGGIIPWLVVL